jgi:hypothetical protein
LNILALIEWFPSYAIKISNISQNLTKLEQVYWINVLKAKGENINIK